MCIACIKKVPVQFIYINDGGQCVGWVADVELIKI